MQYAFDRVAEVLASGLSRRRALKAFVAASGGVLMSRWIGGETAVEETAFAAQGHAEGTAGSVRQAVSLLIELPGGHTPVIHLRDRHPGRISYQGEHITMIPHIMDVGQVELAVYRGPQTSPALQKRVTLPLEAGSIAEMARTQLNLAFMPGLAVAVGPRGEVAAETQAEMMSGDCSVWCCWQGSLSGCACCCTQGDPSCGSCCDAGCCPACNPPA